MLNNETNSCHTQNTSIILLLHIIIMHRKREIPIVENPRYVSANSQQGHNYRFSRDASLMIGAPHLVSIHDKAVDGLCITMGGSKISEWGSIW